MGPQRMYGLTVLGTTTACRQPARIPHPEHVVTSPSFADAFWVCPGARLGAPGHSVTYMFLHAGILHLSR